MLMGGKKVGAGTLIFIFILSFASYYWKKNTPTYNGRKTSHGRKTSLSKPYDHFCSGQPTSDTITRLKDNHSFIIAPYFDGRDGKMIRVISIVHYEEVRKLYCVFCCPNDRNISIVRAEIDFHEDRFDFPYGTADVLCWEPRNCSPRYMSVQPSRKLDFGQLPIFEIKNRKFERPSRDFTVCMSPMFGDYNNILQFVQIIEMYKILGAQKVFIYKHRCSQLMDKILRYYVLEGTIEIVPWPIDLYLRASSSWHYSIDPKDIGYYGQIAALNDCVYQNMYRSNYVLLIDADEIILPIKDTDWTSLMKRLQEENSDADVFLFENHVFSTNGLLSTSPFDFPSWSRVPGVNILEHVFRKPDTNVNNKKMIVRPKSVIQTSVHSVLKNYGIPVEVSSDVALLYHCREYNGEAKEIMIPDPIIWRYNTSLIANVNQILHKCDFL